MVIEVCEQRTEKVFGKAARPKTAVSAPEQLLEMAGMIREHCSVNEEPEALQLLLIGRRMERLAAVMI